MVRIVAVLAMGILTGIHYPEFVSPTAANVFLIIFASAYYPVRLALRRRPMAQQVVGMLALSLIYFAGIRSVQLRVSTDAYALINNSDRIQAYRVNIVSTAERKDRSWKCVGQVLDIRTPSGWRTAMGGINLYWPHSEDIQKLEYGDVLIIKGSPQRVQGPRNPHEFNHAQYLAYRNIHHQHYIRANQWVLESTGLDRGLRYYASQARTWTATTIDRFVDGSREQAIVKAFVIGITEGVDDELKQAYTASGAMHALAVSGLHVSILYGVLLLILRPLDKHPAGQWTVALVSLFVLWMFGFLTGLSPSVLRAVTMFSFVAIAKPINRTTSIYNTLAASAFFLLLYDPFLILSAGFLLSYLAVLGIVMLYRPVYNLMECRWAITDWMWQITAVSIAAQLGTMPLTLYYFHQFPIYFLLANLFVIPASMIILLGGILMLVLSWVNFAAVWIGKGLHVMVYLLHEGLFWIEQLPFSVIHDIHFTALQCWCIGSGILGMYFLLSTKKFFVTIFIVTLVVAFSMENWREHGVVRSRKEFVVYHIVGSGALEWTIQDEVLLLVDSALSAIDDKIRFHVNPNQQFNRVRGGQPTPVSKNSVWYRVAGKDFLWIRSGPVPAVPVDVDYLIIGGNAVRSLDSLVDTINFDHLILDSSNSLRYCEQLQAEAERLGKPVFSVLASGAFTMKL